MLSAENRARIQRLFYAEKWKIGTIALQLSLHHSTVRRVLGAEGSKSRGPGARLIDPHLPFVREVLEQYPRLTASRLYAMVRERGYAGGPDHFRHLISGLRPAKTQEAYLRLRALPGEQAQVDWGHFGTMRIGRAVRRLYAFVLVLSFSRAIFVRFFLDSRLTNLLRGHVAAFEHHSGCARNHLYDNMKSAVLERQGDAVRFHPTLMDFSGHYHYGLQAAAVGRGNEKGRVERAVGYLRTSFFPLRQNLSLSALNEQALDWCSETSARRSWPQDRSLTVRQALAWEKPHLLTLPDDPFPTEERREVKVAKTPYVRFDGNDYSVPPDYVQRTLVVLASETRVRVLSGDRVLAEHSRCYSKGEQIEDEKHLRLLTLHKRTARRKHRGFDRLFSAAPATETLMQQLAERGENLGTRTAALLKLLDLYSASALQKAVLEALERGSPRPQSVQMILERQRISKHQPPALPVRLPDDPRLRELTVRPHDLSDYDQLLGDLDEDDEL